MRAKGVIYSVATPIGNLKDITLRAIEVLREVTYIAAEDTRLSRRLLNHLLIQKPLISLHEHNERQKSQALLDKVIAGESLALITDAGTPLISDPGFHFIRQAQLQGIRVIPIPGPCALIAALSVSGIPTHRFSFEGFLPPKKGQRLQKLAELVSESRTMIFYEAPHRVIATVDDFIEVFGTMRECVLARELTKTFETIWLGTLEDLKIFLSNDPNQQKGEIVLVLAGTVPLDTASDEGLSEEQITILKILLAELPLKQAVKLAADITHVRKNKLYDWAVQSEQRGEKEDE